MRKVFPLLIGWMVFLTCICSAASTDWKYVDADGQRQSYYVDMKHVKMKGDTGTSNLRIDHPKDGYSYTIYRLEFKDLKDGSFRVVLSHGDLHNMYGNLIGRYKEDTKGVVKEGTILWKACQMLADAANSKEEGRERE